MASKMMAGLKAKAAEAGKAKQAAKSAMADKMKTAAKDFMAKKSAAPKPAPRSMSNTTGAMGGSAPARPTERIPRPAGTVSPNAAKMVGKPFGGTGGGMGSMAGRGGMGARPAMTPQVKQGLLDMSNKLRGMPMKKGGKTKK